MSANPQPLIATIYNPHNQSKEALIAGFIARRQKFERLFRDIRDASMTKPEQHYLIQGVRGTGKTSFLLRIVYEIENTSELRERLIPVVFNEEEYGIGSLADIWERTAKYVEEADGAFAGLLDTITAQYGQPDYEQRALDTLIIALRQHNKKLLLLIDNIGDLLKKLDNQEEKRLREVLLTVPELRLVGATSVVIEQAHDYGKPFYEFFKVIHLEGLSREESTDLFLKLGETYHADAIQQIIEQQPGRIEAIRRLTGGVIRTMVLLFEIMVENNSGSVFRDLNVLLDRVTPLYKHRMDDLPTQQQKIVAALASAWDAASAKELAQVVRLESKVVSAQLKQLIDNSVVEKIETKTKNHLYRLKERFFNIWYLMRFGRKTDQRVLWLVRFFEEMFGGNPEWMQERIDGHLQAMELGTLDPEAALFLTTAFAGVLKDEELEDLLKKRTRIYLLQIGRGDLAKSLPYSKQEDVSQFMLSGKFDSALYILENLNVKTEDTYLDLAACYLFTSNLRKSEGALASSFISNPETKQRITEAIEEIKAKGDPVKSSNVAMIGVSQIFYVPVKSPSKAKVFVNLENITATEVAYRYFDKKKVEKRLLALALTGWQVNDKLFATQMTNLLLIKKIIELWNNKFDTVGREDYGAFAQDVTQEMINGFGGKGREMDIGQTYLKLLLAKKQYHTAYNYFQQEEWQLKDRFKPLYYATLHFLRDEYPTEYLRMGPELKETVDDILAEVAQMAIDYA